MKKIIAGLLLSLAIIAPAHAHGFGRGGFHGGYHGGGFGWVAPAMVGGVIGYEIGRTYYPPQVYVQPPVVYTQPYTCPYGTTALYYQNGAFAGCR